MGKIKKALLYYVRKTEAKAKAPPGSYWYREFLPDDPGIGGTAKTYTATMSNTVEEHLLAQATAITVPTANAYVSFGWYLDADLGDGGYLRTEKNSVVKSETIARMVYNQKDPKHMYLDFDHIIFGQEQDLIGFKIYNGFGADQICMALPVMFRIASKGALNLEGGA